MNAARMQKSDRLQRVWNVLKGGVPVTTQDIIRFAHVCAVNSIVSELRANGKKIECKRKGDVWFYRRIK